MSHRGLSMRGFMPSAMSPNAHATRRTSLENLMEQTRNVESPSKETGTAYDSENPSADDGDTCPYGCCEKESLSDFILKRGFFEGACSDITIRAFNQDYRLHKLILDRSGYFSSLFNGPWNDPSNTTHELIFEDDENITQESFELAIARLYGAVKPKAEIQHILSMIAIGQYLDIPEVVCNATDNIVNSLNFDNIARFTSFASMNDYGKASERIIDSAKGLLCSDGWQNGFEKWDGVPVSIIAYVVGHDAFFVPSEWERALFIMKLIERRQSMNRSSSSGSVSELDEEEDVEPLINALNTKVHYCHLSAEQLHKLETYVDNSGKPHIDPSVLKNALWLSVLLYRKVATAEKKSNELGLVTTSEAPPNKENTWFIPTKDETLYGTPQQLEESIKSHHHIRDDMPSGKTTENAGDAVYKVTKVPPFRFSIAFSQVSELEAEKRVYAKTLWYAGSYWNLYIQKIRHRKGYQMGVYIHRASNSAPSRSALLNRDVFKNSTYSLDNDSSLSNIIGDVNNLMLNDEPEASNDTLSSFTKSELNAAPDEEEEEEEEENDNSFLSYEDNRIKTSVYYVIYTPSRKVKTSLTCFISTPDLFNKSQSWGWKSNSMCSFNDDGTLADGQDKLLKFMVVLGNT